MANSKGAKDFLLGAVIGGVIGVAAASGMGKKKLASLHKIRNTVGHFSKALKASQNGDQLLEILDWASEGIQLWNKLKRG
jgi:gas vesicle protein